MPIKQYVNGKLGSADLHRLNLAYAKALRALHLVDREGPVTDIVAKKVIEIGMTAPLLNAQEIADAAAKHFRELR